MKLDKSEHIRAQNIARALEKARWKDLSGAECLALASAINWFQEALLKELAPKPDLKVQEPPLKLTPKTRGKSKRA